MQYYHTFGTKKPMHFDILTIFPEMFAGPLSESIIKRAIQAGRISVGLHNIRDYALDKHHTTDDAPYGGSQGMVMKCEPIFEAVEELKKRWNDECRMTTLEPADGIESESFAVRHPSFEGGIGPWSPWRLAAA